MQDTEGTGTEWSGLGEVLGVCLGHRLLWGEADGGQKAEIRCLCQTFADAGKKDWRKHVRTSVGRAVVASPK